MEFLPQDLLSPSESFTYDAIPRVSLFPLALCLIYLLTER